MRQLSTTELAEGHIRWMKMLANSPQHLQGVVCRYGELLFAAIKRLPAGEQVIFYNEIEILEGRDGKNPSH